MLEIDPRLATYHVARPKGRDGLWVEVELVDGRVLDTVIPNAVDALTPWTEITLRFHPARNDKSVMAQQRSVTIPRCEIVRFEVLGLIGGGMSKL
jgi:hypothetical protein